MPFLACLTTRCFPFLTRSARLFVAALLVCPIWAEVPAAVAPSYANAKAALDAGQFADAARMLGESLAELPPDTAGIGLLYLAQGTAFLRGGQPEKAIAPLEKAVLSDASVLPLLADSFRGAGRKDDAMRAYEKAASGDSLNAGYSRARLSELQSAGEPDATKAAALLFAAADAFAALGAEEATYIAEATKLYEAIARNKVWRGESTARAVFSLGEVERGKKAFPEAIAYYQRCFVSWSKYVNWSARAYLRAADSFEALGRRTEAKEHLRELVRKDAKYGKLPEFAAAKTRLRAWGDVVP